MGYNPQEALENPINTMGTLLGVHPIVPWLFIPVSWFLRSPKWGSYCHSQLSDYSCSPYLRHQVLTHAMYPTKQSLGILAHLLRVGSWNLNTMLFGCDLTPKSSSENITGCLGNQMVNILLYDCNDNQLVPLSVDRRILKPRVIFLWTTKINGKKRKRPWKQSILKIVILNQYVLP